MKLTSLDIRKQEFTRTFRGYDAEEVHAFLRMVAEQWQDLLDEKTRLEERLREQEMKLQHYMKVEEALEQALQTARESSRQAIENAERKARLLLQEAEARAEEIKREAAEERLRLKREAAQISGRKNEIVTRLRAFLLSEMELLAHYEGDDPVGFIKLLPGETPAAAARFLGARPEAEAPAEGGEAAGAAPGEASGEATATPEAGREGETADEEALPPLMPEEDEVLKELAAELAGMSPAEETPEGEATTPPDEAEAGGGEAHDERPAWQAVSEGNSEGPASEARPGRPGWRVNTLVTPGQGPGGSAADTEEAASSDEIAKIRRILDDLD